MKIGELRSITNDALARAGLEERKLFVQGAKALCLPEGALTRFFQPQPYRRGWGFVFTGLIGLEIPELRRWIVQHHPTDAGIFHHSFVAYHTLNDADRSKFMIEEGEPVPADQWAAAIHRKLANLPSTIDALVSEYRTKPEGLGLLADPLQAPAWRFLMRWADSADAALNIPRSNENGRIIE
jgi:hypothetical protein